MLFHISLQNTCLSTTQTMFKAAVPNGAVWDPRHQLPPSGKEYRKWLEKIETEKEGWPLLRSQLSTRLPPSVLLQGHWCSLQCQTRARLNPQIACSEDAWPLEALLFSFQIQSCFAKQLANTHIGCTGPSWLAGSKNESLFILILLRKLAVSPSLAQSLFLSLWLYWTVKEVIFHDFSFSMQGQILTWQDKLGKSILV